MKTSIWEIPKQNYIIKVAARDMRYFVGLTSQWFSFTSEAFVWRCFVEKVFLEISQNSQVFLCDISKSVTWKLLARVQLVFKFGYYFVKGSKILLLSLNELGEKFWVTITLANCVNKP